VVPEAAYKNAELVDGDGLPHVGAAIWPGQSYYSAMDRLTGKVKGGKLKGEETAVVDQVAIVGQGKDKGVKQANIKLRFNRNPVIGGRGGACECGGWHTNWFCTCSEHSAIARPDVQCSRMCSARCLSSTSAECAALAPVPASLCRRQVCVAPRPEGCAVPPV
jgi:hypothetical protein